VLFSAVLPYLRLDALAAEGEQAALPAGLTEVGAGAPFAGRALVYGPFAVAWQPRTILSVRAS
jgi:hypothetical protein